jgi:hypothetical protein
MTDDKIPQQANNLVEDNDGSENNFASMGQQTASTMNTVGKPQESSDNKSTAKNESSHKGDEQGTSSNVFTKIFNNVKAKFQKD